MNQDVRRYYAQFGEREWGRLDNPADGQVEFAITCDALARRLPLMGGFWTGLWPGRYTVVVSNHGRARARQAWRLCAELRGLSAACAAALWGDIHNRGRQPSWTTTPISGQSAVAEKLGFTLQRHDRIVVGRATTRLCRCAIMTQS